ncbi:MAG: crossover junction endodeoxyribonuclease RuvC [Terriglobales bacterium]
MLVLGIDCGSQATGFGLVESDGRRHRARASGTIRLPRAAQASFAQRLHLIHTRLTELMLAERPDSVAIEDVFYAKNVRTALQLSHVRGVAMQAAAAQGLAVAEYSPRAIKNALTGYGNADKTQVLHMVRSLLALEEDPETLDASDALAVAICHLHSTPPKL